MVEKLHDTLGELYRSRSHERYKPDRGEALDLDGSPVENVGGYNTEVNIYPEDDAQRKIDQAGHGCVAVFEEGTHQVALDVPEDITLKGRGTRTELQRDPDQDKPVIKMHGTDNGGPFHNEGRIFDMKIDGDPEGNDNYTTPVVSAKLAGKLIFRDLDIYGKNATVPGLFLQEVWDCRYINVDFRECGNSSSLDSAGIVLYNGPEDNTNNHYFYGCRWEPITGVPIYSDNSGAGENNHNVRLTDCKFHGHPGDDRRPAGAFVQGPILHMSIQSTQMLFSLGGFVNVSGYRSRVTGSSFVADAGATDVVIDANGGDCVVANNTFGSTGSDWAIDVQAYKTNVIGNTIDNKGIRLRRARGACIGNAIRDAPKQGIYADGDYNMLISSNAVVNVGGHGIHVGLDRALVGLNQIKGAGDHSIYGDGVAESTFIGNVSDSPTNDDIRTTYGPNAVVGNVFRGGSVVLAGVHEVWANIGYTTHNDGSATVSDGDSIPHGLPNAPSYVSLTTSAQGHIAAASNVDGTDITVQLTDDAGNAVGADETVYWEAKIE